MKIRIKTIMMTAILSAIIFTGCGGSSGGGGSSDKTAPQTGAGIIYSNIVPDSLTVDWGAATDETTAQNSLSYKLVRAASKSAIDTVAEADAVTGSGLIMDWSVNTLTCQVTNLIHGTTYYFTVLVKDGSGNEAIYNPVDVETEKIAQWAQTADPAPSESWINSVATDPNGDIYAAGYINGTNEFDFSSTVSATGTYDNFNILLVKYDTEGTAQWAQTVETGPNYSYFNSVTVDSDSNIYAAGEIYGTVEFKFGNSVTATGKYTSGNILLVKYDSDGTAQWAQTVTTGPNFSWFNSVTTDTDGNVYAAGVIYDTGTYDFGNSKTAQGSYGGGANIVLVKYNSSGQAQWAQSVDSGWLSEYYSVCTDSDGNVFAAGIINVKNEFNFGNSVKITPAYDGSNLAIVKYNSSGQAQWVKSVTTDTNNSYCKSITVDADGNIYAAGEIDGTDEFGFGNGVTAKGAYDSNIVVVKYNSSGIAQWAQTVVSGSGNSWFNSVALDSYGNIYAAGEIDGTDEFDFGNNVKATGVNSNSNIIIVKYGPSDGKPQWAQTVNSGLNYSRFNSITLDSDENLYVAGEIRGTNDFSLGNGVTATGNYSGSNIVLVKYK